MRQWLIDAGFEPHGDGWLVSEADLGQVLESEVTAVADHEEPNGEPAPSDRGSP